MKIYLAAILFLVITTACNPDRFTLNQISDIINYGQILDSLDTFEQIDDNSFFLKNGRVAIKSKFITQTSFNFNYQVMNGESIRFTLRTISHNYDNTNGVTFEIRKSGLKIFENGNEFHYDNKIKLQTGAEKFISFRSVGDKIIFRHDCDELIYTTKLPATEYLIIQVYDNSQVKITGFGTEKIISNSIEKKLEF